MSSYNEQVASPWLSRPLELKQEVSNQTGPCSRGTAAGVGSLSHTTCAAALGSSVGWEVGGQPVIITHRWGKTIPESRA